MLPEQVRTARAKPKHSCAHAFAYVLLYVLVRTCMGECVGVRARMGG